MPSHTRFPLANPVTLIVQFLKQEDADGKAPKSSSSMTRTRSRVRGQMLIA